MPFPSISMYLLQLYVAELQSTNSVKKTSVQNFEEENSENIAPELAFTGFFFGFHKRLL